MRTRATKSATVLSLAVLFLDLPVYGAKSHETPLPSAQRIIDPNYGLCPWVLGQLGRMVSENPDLVATHRSFSGAAAVSRNGEIYVYRAAKADEMERGDPVPREELIRPKQMVFDFPLDGDPYDFKVPLNAGETITASAFGVGGGDASRIILGTSEGRIIVLNPNNEGQILGNSLRANDGEGPIRKISVSAGGMGFTVIRGDRVSAHMADDGSPLWYFHEEFGRTGQTHPGGVTDIQYIGYPNPATFVTVGKDGKGRLYRSRYAAESEHVEDDFPLLPSRLFSPDVQPRRKTFQLDERGPEFPMRIISEPGDNFAGLPIEKVAISSNEERRLIATGDKNGRVLLYKRHLIPSKFDKDPAVVLFKGDGRPVSAMLFSESQTVPKMLVTKGDGSSSIVRFDVSDSKMGIFDLRTESPITSAAWIDNDTLLVGMKNGSIVKWGLRKPARPRVLDRYQGHTNSVESLTIIQEGKAFVSVSADGTIRGGPMDTADKQALDVSPTPLDTQLRIVRPRPR